MSGHFGLQTAAGHLTVPAESKESYAADVEQRFRADAAQIIARYPQKRSALLPMLHLVQSVDGYITGRGIDLCAELLDLTTAEVSGVATFYTQYKRHPNGRYTVGVCTNTLCAIMGGDAIWEAVSEHLGIGHDETTEDGMITLERVECNAACDFAPVVMTNWEFFDNQTPESTIQLVDDLRAGKDVTPSRGPDKVVSFQEMSRVLAGFLDGRADEGPGAGSASLAGLEVAHAQGWTAPALAPAPAAQDDAPAAADSAPEPAPAAALAPAAAPAPTATADEANPEVTPASDEAAATKKEPAATPERTEREGTQASEPAAEPEEEPVEAQTPDPSPADVPKSEQPVAERTEKATPATLFDTPKAESRGDFADGGFGEHSAKPGADGSAPAGWDIKGNANSKLFHTPESPWYARTKAEVWFRDAESAIAAGFTDARERRQKGKEQS
jgi:NADH-quinone oxidoreductase subunit E